MASRLRYAAIAVAAASLIVGAARAAESEQSTQPPSHRTKPAIAAPVSPEGQEAAKKAHADYAAAVKRAKVEYRKTLADARAARQKALADIAAAEKSKR